MASVKEEYWYKNWRLSVSNAMENAELWGATEILLIGIKGEVGKNMATITEFPALQLDLQDAASKKLLKVTWENVESRLIDINKLPRVLKEVKDTVYAVIASCPSTHFEKATELSRGNRNVQCCWGRVDDISGLERPMQNLTMAGKSAAAAEEEHKTNTDIADRDAAVYKACSTLYDWPPIKQDRARAKFLFNSLRDSGNAVATAMCYAYGWGVAKDTARALQLMTQSAQTSPLAQCLIGRSYAREDPPLGVNKDDKEAVRWYRAAAEQGHAIALNSLGWMYDTGRGVPQDYKEAVRWYRAAAEQGDANAQSSLGWMYKRGRGVPQDDKEAVRWFRAAAEQGHATAQCSLGWMYDNGRGVPQDDKEAVRWYRAAAEQGCATAQSNLGLMYEEGLGVPKDDKEAVRWYRAAAEQGDAKAKSELDRLTSS